MDLKLALNAATEVASVDETRAEHEFDTRATEAAYLAIGEARRIAEIEELLEKYKNLELKNFNENSKIDLTALVEVEADGKIHYYFISPFEGGTHYMIDGVKVNVINPKSPLGEELMGREVKDIFDIETPSGMHSYFIVSIQ